MRSEREWLGMQRGAQNFLSTGQIDYVISFPHPLSRLDNSWIRDESLKDDTSREMVMHNSNLKETVNNVIIASETLLSENFPDCGVLWSNKTKLRGTPRRMFFLVTLYVTPNSLSS